MDLLPNDINIKIVLYLPNLDALNFSLVSKKYYTNIWNNEYFWWRKCKLENIDKSLETWKDSYNNRYLLIGIFSTDHASKSYIDTKLSQIKDKFDIIDIRTDHHLTNIPRLKPVIMVFPSIIICKRNIWFDKTIPLDYTNCLVKNVINGEIDNFIDI